MKVIDSGTRDEYLSEQIARSREKFSYCKISIRDCLRYKEIVAGDLDADGGSGWSRRREQDLGPVACFGTRNGREVDLFRIAFFQSSTLAAMVRNFEVRGLGIQNKYGFLNGIGRSNVETFEAKAAIGVEINPDGGRQDVWVGSFDSMPAEWESGFQVVYSNSFDQSMSPEATAREWRRVVKPNGYLILCFSGGQEPTRHDPVGMISSDDVINLFGGELVYYRRRGSAVGYDELILRFRA
jgi:hypothetical protein